MKNQERGNLVRAAVVVFAPTLTPPHEFDDDEAFYRAVAHQYYGHSEFWIWIIQIPDITGPKFEYVRDIFRWFAEIAKHQDEDDTEVPDSRPHDCLSAYARAYISAEIIDNITVRNGRIH